MPNPAFNFIILKEDIPPVYEQVTFTVYHIVGKEILQQKYRQGQILEQINVSQWARGMYSYKVTAQGKVLKTGKVVVEH
jgi:guanylate kinase